MSITINDVAKRAKVTNSTVSKVVNNYPYISPETKQKVEESIRDLGYIPNEFAKSLAFGKNRKISAGKLTYRIGCIVYTGYDKYTNAGNEMPRIFMEGITRELKNHKYRLHFYYSCDELANDPILLHEEINRNTIDGLVVISSQLEGIYEQVTKNIKNIVSIDEPLHNSLEYDCILSDRITSVYNAMKYLVDLGHRRIAYIWDVGFSDLTFPKFEGYKKAIKDFGLEYDESIIAGRGVSPNDFKGNSVGKQIEAGYVFMNKILNDSTRLPTAVFSASDESVVGILRALKEKNLRVPEDI